MCYNASHLFHLNKQNVSQIQQKWKITSGDFSFPRFQAYYCAMPFIKLMATSEKFTLFTLLQCRTFLAIFLNIIQSVIFYLTDAFNNSVPLHNLIVDDLCKSLFDGEIECCFLTQKSQILTLSGTFRILSFSSFIFQVKNLKDSLKPPS